MDVPARPVAFDAAAFDAACQALREQAAAGGYQASTEALEALRSTCPPDDLGRRARVATLLAHQWPRLGKLTHSMRHATEAVGLAQRVGEQQLLASAFIAQSFVYSQLLMGREGLEAGLRALACARQARDAVAEAWALNRIGVAYATLENPSQACASTEQALEIAVSAGKPGSEVLFSCLNNLAYFWLQRVDEAALLEDEASLAVARQQARVMAERACAQARQSASPFQVSVAVSNLVGALLSSGRVDEALPLLDEFEQLACTNGYAALALEAQAQRAVHLRLTGQPREAAERLEALLTGPPEPAPQRRRMLIHALYEAHKACGQYPQALHWLEQQSRQERRMRRDTLALQSEIILIREQVEQAQARADVAAAAAQRERDRAMRLEQERQRLHRQALALDRAAHEDVLTGLHNRRHAEFALPLLLQGARSAGQPVCVALMDVDHFKQVNDNHGHAVGDAVLQRLARLLRQRLRSADLLARFGGEEFLAVLPGLEPTQALDICERLREAVEAEDWSDLAPGLAVSLSIGIAGGRGSQPAVTLLACSDRALYAAKRTGRNRVLLDDSTLDNPAA
ncbi:MAG: hypothetical protein DI603_05305 [Roseateles depolymerans]|uniref:diguanylate cyclase n=1 Tax=Roseateles depolymerans TaxID=76731 RepID=A0A2W5FN25_9BURK|nr:MAG: hypothetical protein DI603_05305 [Roseateles depolymerans]